MAGKPITEELNAACMRYYKHFGQMYPYAFNNLKPDEAIKEIDEGIKNNAPIPLDPYAGLMA